MTGSRIPGGRPASKQLARRGICITFILIIAGMSSGCQPQPPPRPEAIVYGSPYQPNTLNPITAPDIVSRSMIDMIFEGLVVADDKLGLQKRLASSWVVSPDGREYTFRLKEGVRWHDGQELTADDVKFTYDTVTNPDSKPTISKADYASISRVEVADRYTVRFVLSQPNAAFLSRLSLGIAPKHLLEGQDLATSPFNTRPVGTGPFVLQSWSPGESIVLSRNPEYHGSKAGVGQIIWKIVPDSNMLALQVMNGEIDGAPIFSPRDAATFRDTGRTVLHETVEGNTQISLQLKNPLFQDTRVRQALAYAIDKRALIDQVMMGAAVPATSDILPSSWAYNSQVPAYDYDPARARALLAEAGWSPGSDGILTKNGHRFEISLMTDAGHKLREQVMLAVRQDWADLGIEVKAGVQERNSFVFQRVLKGDFDAVLLQSSVQVDPDISRRFHSKSIGAGQNFLNYSNPEVDRLLDMGLETNDQASRVEAYSQAQRILAEDLPQISLFHPKVIYAFKPDVLGVRPSPINLFWNAEEWRWRN